MRTEDSRFSAGQVADDGQYKDPFIKEDIR